MGCVLQPDKYKGDSKEEFILWISKCKFDDLRKCAAEIVVDKIDLQFSKFWLSHSHSMFEIRANYIKQVFLTIFRERHDNNTENYCMKSTE